MAWRDDDEEEAEEDESPDAPCALQATVRARLGHRWVVVTLAAVGTDGSQAAYYLNDLYAALQARSGYRLRHGPGQGPVKAVALAGLLLCCGSAMAVLALGLWRQWFAQGC